MADELHFWLQEVPQAERNTMSLAETDMLAALKDEIRLVVDERQSGVVEEVADRYQSARPSLRLTPV